VYEALSYESMRPEDLGLMKQTLSQKIFQVASGLIDT
jgi:hypothetical protein